VDQVLDQGDEPPAAREESDGLVLLPAQRTRIQTRVGRGVLGQRNVKEDMARRVENAPGHLARGELEQAVSSLEQLLLWGAGFPWRKVAVLPQ